MTGRFGKTSKCLARNLPVYPYPARINIFDILYLLLLGFDSQKCQVFSDDAQILFAVEFHPDHGHDGAGVGGFFAIELDQHVCGVFVGKGKALAPCFKNSMFELGVQSS